MVGAMVRTAWMVLMTWAIAPAVLAAADVPAALPGAVAFEPALRENLVGELRERGDGYEPRTRHLRPDGAPIYTNRLLLETSPYLQQHAHNPVDWRPWGDEAFAAARKLDRPVLVSIGYSTCHWCHVMEEESFDDTDVARFLNAYFITIKVDRETRPDVDSIYMTSVQALTGSGGWPLNVWLTPDREPFYGGTYFPPTDRGNRPGFPSVLASIRDQWKRRRGELVEMAGSLTETVRQQLESVAAASSQRVGPDVLAAALRTYKQRADPIWGGIGRSTKFPSALPVRLLLRIHRRSGDPDALEMAELALEKMASGGLQDQIGGGFHRYSTEPRWLVPHFEKMLYDNALLAVAYLEGWQASGREEFARVTRRTLDYVAREMTAPDGGFYSATDADSRNPEGEMEEGWFFTWTPEEIDRAVGPKRGRVLRAAYGVTQQGNFEGRNILTTWTAPAKAASSLAMTQAAFAAALEDARAALLEARRGRPPPLRDDKILTAWNGLMISAFARAGFAFDRADYLALARGAAHAALAGRDAAGRLPRARQNQRSSGPAFLEDYAFLIAGLIDLYEATGVTQWLREAVALQAVLDRHYADTAGGGYYRTASDAEALLAREKPAHDGAVPSGNAVSAMNLVRLYDLTLTDAYAETVSLLFSAFAPIFEGRPSGVSELLLALDYQLDKGFEIVIVGGDDGAADLLTPLRDSFVPNRVLSQSLETDAPAHAALVPLLSDKRAVGGRATAYVCRNRVCDYPTNDPAKLRQQLSTPTALDLQVRPPRGL